MNEFLSKIKKKADGKFWFIFAFVLPPFLLYFYFSIVPMIKSFALSFFSRDGKTFVAFDNYLTVFREPNFTGAIVNDLLILLFKEIIVIALAMLFAISITRLKFAKGETNFLRYIYYIPNILSIVVISKVWLYFFNFNLPGQLFGLKMPSEGWIFKYPTPIITFVASWCGIGMFMIIFIAGINNISKELYEAAEIDGAGQMRQLWAITVPALLPQVRYAAVSIVTSIVASNTNFVKLFMGDSAHGSGFTVMGVYEYNEFDRLNFDTAYASAVIIMVIVFSVSFLLNRLIREKED